MFFIRPVCHIDFLIPQGAAGNCQWLVLQRRNVEKSMEPESTQHITIILLFVFFSAQENNTSKEPSAEDIKDVTCAETVKVELVMEFYCCRLSFGGFETYVASLENCRYVCVQHCKFCLTVRFELHQQC